MTGDLPGTVDAIKASVPWLIPPLKAAVAFPIIYHYAGGVRHIYWDKARYGNMADKNSPLDLGPVDASSYAVFGLSAVGAAAAALYSF